MYIISSENIEKGDFEVRLFTDDWYWDANYKALALLEGKKVGM